MSSSDPSRDVYSETLAVFDQRNDPLEPLTTPDVAESLDTPRRTVYKRLEKLVDRGELKTKKAGANARVWWRPGSLTDRPSAKRSPDTQSVPALSNQDRNHIKRFLEASPVSIVVVEPSGDISFANERAEETLSLERDEITNRTYRETEWNIAYEDGTSVPIEEHPVTRVLETGKPDYGFEHWIALPDGTERWLSSNSAPVLNEDGDVEYVVVGFEDATPLKKREDKLTSDKRRLVELYSEELFQPYLDATDGGVRIDVDEVITLSDGTALQYITATGISAKALSDVFKRHFAVLDVRLLTSTDKHCRFGVHTKGPTLPLIFDDLGGRVNALVRSRTDEPPVLTGILPGDIDPRTVLQEARQLYPDIELNSQDLRYTPRLLYNIVEDSLTDKQFAALRTAYYGGYFTTPRKSAGDELADQLGVTRQAFHQHLRKAEQTVFKQLFEASGKRELD